MAWSRPTSDWGTIPARYNLRAISLFTDSKNLLISGKLIGKFLRDLMRLSSSDTMRNPLLKAKSRQHVSYHLISRQRLRKFLGRSENSYGVISADFLIWYILLRTLPSVNHSEFCFKMTPYVCQWMLVGSGTEVCAYLQRGSDMQGVSDLDRGLSLTWYMRVCFCHAVAIWHCGNKMYHVFQLHDL